MTDQTQNLSAVEPVAWIYTEKCGEGKEYITRARPEWQNPRDLADAEVIIQPLYTSPPITSAAVAAALMKSEEVCETTYVSLDDVYCTKAADIIRDIPRDESALRDVLIEAITAYARQVATKNNGNLVLLDLEEAMAIVERVLKGEA